MIEVTTKEYYADGIYVGVTCDQCGTHMLYTPTYDQAKTIAATMRETESMLVVHMGKHGCKS